MLRLAALITLGGLSCSRPGPVRFGIAESSTGVAGAQIAARQINAAGGIRGRPVELVFADRGGDTRAPAAIATAERFAADPTILAVVGHSNSAASLAAAETYNSRHLPQIAPTTTASIFTAAGPYSFRLVPGDDRQAAFLADQVKASPSRRVAILYVNDDYGRALDAALRDSLAPARVVYESPYTESGTDEALVASAAAAGAAHPELLVWLGRPPQLEQFLPRFRAGCPSCAVLGSDAVGGYVMYQHPERFEGVRFTRFVDPTSDDPRFVAFRDAVRRSSVAPLADETALAYDAVMLAAAAVRAGAADREAVREYLASIGRTRPAFDGVTGPIAFDDSGDVAHSRAPLLAEARGGVIRPVAP